LDLLKRKTNEEHIRYPIIHLKGDDIELAITHEHQYGEDYYSYVNGQYTQRRVEHIYWRFVKHLPKQFVSFTKRNLTWPISGQVLLPPFR
jgi:hypothetical protein